MAFTWISKASERTRFEVNFHLQVFKLSRPCMVRLPQLGFVTMARVIRCSKPSKNILDKINSAILKCGEHCLHEIKISTSKELSFFLKRSLCNAGRILSAYLSGVFYPPHDYSHFVSIKNVSRILRKLFLSAS